ncbi:MAG: hypothetical protein K8I82_32585, partial [Anaerolineae bacterium]|nr:hypothetical protein [Anaerolineae bacterium]
YESLTLVSGQENVNPNAFLIQKLDWQATTLAAQSTMALDWMADFGEGLTTEKGLVSADDWEDDSTVPDWFAPGADFTEPLTASTETVEDAADWFKSIGTAPLALPSFEDIDFGEPQELDDEIIMPATADLDASFDDFPEDDTLIAPLSDQDIPSNQFTPPAWLPTPSEDEFGMAMPGQSIQASWLQPPSELPLDAEGESEILPDWMQSQPIQDERKTEFEGELEWLMSDEFNEQPPSEEPAASDDKIDNSQWMTADEAEPELAAPTDWAASDDSDWLGGIEEIEPEMELDWLAAEDSPAEAGSMPDWLSNAVSEVKEPVESEWLSGIAEPPPDLESELEWLSEDEAPLDAGTSPDWLRSGVSEVKEEAPAPEADWLSSMGEEEAQPESELSWLAEETPASESTGVTDWLAGGVSEVEAEAPAAEADWLSSMGEESQPESELGWLSSEETPATESTGMTDWLAGGVSDVEEEAPAAEAKNLPDWLTEAEEEPGAEPTPESLPEWKAEEEEVPDWLTEEEELPAKALSWMSAFSEEEEEPEEKTSELNAFLADFLDPGAAQIGSLRPMVAQDADLADNKVASDEEESESFDFSFNYDFDKPPAWMRGHPQEEKTTFIPPWMRGGKKREDG